NPPFYSEAYKSNHTQRALARSADALPFRHLIESVAKLLSPDGTFAVIIPHSEAKEFLVLASKEHLYAYRICRVKGSTSSAVKRSLIQFSFKETSLDPKSLIIETARHQYTDEYIQLTEDFYLKM